MCRVLHSMWKSLLWLKPPKFHLQTCLVWWGNFYFPCPLSIRAPCFINVTALPGTQFCRHWEPDASATSMLAKTLCVFFYFALFHITVLTNAALWRNLGHEPMSDQQGRLGIWVLPLGNVSKYRKVCWKTWPAMTMPDTHLTRPSYATICSCYHWARGREMPFSKMTVLEFSAFCYFPLPSCDCPLSLSSLQSAHAQIFNT